MTFKVGDSVFYDDGKTAFTAKVYSVYPSFMLIFNEIFLTAIEFNSVNYNYVYKCCSNRKTV